MLCAVCQAMLKVPWRAAEPRFHRDRVLKDDHHHSFLQDHHATIHSLKTSAQASCYICSRLWQHFLDRPRLIEECGTANPVLRYDFHDLFDEYVTLSFTLNIENPSDSRYRGVPIFRLSQANALSELLHIRTMVTESTNSPSTFSLTQKWLENCLENHGRCKPIPQQSFTPTRLLELDELHLDQISLRTRGPRADQYDSRPYATLSHCWGKHKFVMLTSETYSILSQGIHVSELPRTFQDAIAITRSLGIKFLWIDSLCIIQDSKHDWEVESSLMAKVYSCGLFNIAATASSSGDQGCFRQRQPLQAEATIVQPSWPDRKEYPSCWIFNIEETTEALGCSPLLQRAWVLQEHFLSRRFLHYGSQQLYWDCCELFACERYPNGLPIGMTRPKISLMFFEEQNLQDTDAERGRRIEGLWSNLIKHYSACGLTMERDKLVAISGVAKELLRLNDDTYLAGLWASHLPLQLAWSIEWQHEFQKPPPPKLYRAPSWSWASVKAPIQMYQDKANTAQSLIEVLEAKTIPRSADSTGQIQSGFLRLRGVLTTVVFNQTQSDESIAKSIYISGKWASSSLQTLVVPDQKISTEGGGGVFERNLHFMPLVQLGNPRPQELCGLLLEPTGITPGQFRRFGFLGLAANAYIMPKNLKAANKHDWFEYEEFDGIDLYTITIF